MTTIRLHLTRERAALKPRREPYWGAPLGQRGRVLGIRVVDAHTRYWQARMRDEHNGKLTRALGLDAPGFGYDEACKAAQAWFTARDGGATDEDITAEGACREYVEDRTEKKGEACARDLRLRFERHVYGTDFGAIKVVKLRTPRIEQWRRDTKLGKAAANRTYAALKSALRHAVKRHRLPLDLNREWADVKQYANADGRREVFLDVRQRRWLLEHARDDVRDLIEAAMLTGARPGELVNAKRGQFDERTRSMIFTGKTGSRTVPLSPAALQLFTRLARSKLPTAWLFVQQNGEPWSYTSAWGEQVKAAVKDARLPAGTCLYSMRHAFVTEAITAGMSTLDVAKLTGTSLAMIEKHYGHLVADAARERLAKVAML